VACWAILGFTFGYLTATQSAAARVIWSWRTAAVCRSAARTCHENLPPSELSDFWVPAPPRREPPTRFPMVRGSAIDGPGWSADDTRNPCQIMELEVVARDGIEPSTRGFSVARRARFGAGKLKKRNGFSRRRRNSPRRPNLFRTPQAPTDRTLARGSCGSTSWAHRDRAGTERGRFLRTRRGPGELGIWAV
jgi:hypothetical protein